MLHGSSLPMLFVSGDEMMSSAEEMHAFFEFLAPKLARPQPAIEGMAQRGELVEVSAPDVTVS
jgi:hypothetical protein